MIIRYRKHNRRPRSVKIDFTVCRVKIARETRQQTRWVRVLTFLIAEAEALLRAQERMLLPVGVAN